MRLKNLKTGEVSDFRTDAVFVAIGHQPNTHLFEGQLEMDEIGYLKVRNGSTYTNIDGVFAAGDVADKRLSPGGDRRGHRMHGGDRRRALARSARGALNSA